MHLVQIKDKSSINGFLANQEQNAFLQAWEWSEFLRLNGQAVNYWGLSDNGKISILAGISEKKLGLGRKYYYCPLGPATDRKSFSGSREELGFFWDNLCREIKAKGLLFLRVEPASNKLLAGRKFTKTIDVQPSRTIILDLRNSEEIILKQMRQKTRYNIRLAARKGVAVEEASGSADFEEFWELISQTAQRDGFRLHSRDYYRLMLEHLSRADAPSKERLSLKLFFARYRGELLAAAIVAFFGKYATYMHGASANDKRNLMAPYALQWQAIQEARRGGYEYYDLYGIDEHAWPGVTRFKRGFGGAEVSRPGAFDLPFSRVYYNLYRSLRYFRRKYL